jgi:peptidoglycan hydrolase CwlO-like protein
MSTTTVAPPIPYAGFVGSNMISPAVPFVDAAGMIAPVNWRFLYSVFTAVNAAYQQMTTEFINVESRLTALYNQVDINTTDIANNYNAIQTLETQVSGLQSQINTINGEITTINNRLAAAGIP